MMNRKKYVDYIKCTGMILVILGHINFANEVVKVWIYSFHMPVFFFAAGLVIKKTDINREYIQKKISSLLVPYFLWGLIYAGLNIQSIARIIYGSYSALLNTGSLTSLWFLPVMFFSLLLVQLIFKFTDNKVAFAAIAVSLLVISPFLPLPAIGYLWCLDVITISVPFVLFGYLFENVFSKHNKPREFLIMFIGGMLLTFAYLLNSINAESYVLMAERRIGNIFWFSLSAFGGCLMIYGLSRLAEHYLTNDKFLGYIGRNTLIVFCVQKPIISVFEKIFNVVRIPNTLQLIITLIFVLVASAVMAYIINDYAPCLAGKKK